MAGERLTVLTWNTARMDYTHKPDQNKVLQFLLAQDVDVVCLQEVDVYKDGRYLTLADVRKAMSAKYPYSYIDFSVYDRRHQFGTMVWSRYPLIHKQSIHYETCGNLSNRCDIVMGEDTFRLINNHLESYKFTPDDIKEMETLSYEGIRATYQRLKAKWERAIPLRNNQARTVREEIDASPYPVIVVGDFNAPALSFAYRHISAGLHDAWNCIHPWSWGATCEKRGIGLRIDYILTSDQLQPVACEIKTTTASDHKPVVATLNTNH